jgi:hypothetical protein
LRRQRHEVGHVGVFENEPDVSLKISGRESSSVLNNSEYASETTRFVRQGNAVPDELSRHPCVQRVTPLIEGTSPRVLGCVDPGEAIITKPTQCLKGWRGAHEAASPRN